MFNKKLTIGFTILTILFVVTNCNSIKTDNSKITKTEQSLFWESNDSEIVADSVVNTFLKSKWNLEFNSKSKPKIIVGAIIDSTSENVDVELLSKNIERSFIDSGEITFISSKSKREIIRNNRKNKDEFKNKKELKNYLKSLKSNFFISGTLFLSIDSTLIPIQKKYDLVVTVIESKSASLAYSHSEVVIK
jgi:PBP1b-binding outer membrane lipoprotein LpoB